MPYVHNLIHDRDLKATDIVCTHINKVYGEKALKLVDKRVIELMNYIIHYTLKDFYILINNYEGNSIEEMQKFPDVHFYEERGMRCNICKSSMNRTRGGDLVLEPHILGKAVDFTVYDKKLIEDAVIENLTTYDDNEQEVTVKGSTYSKYFDQDSVPDDDVPGFIETLEQAKVRTITLEENGNNVTYSIHDFIANSLIGKTEQIQCRIDYSIEEWIHLDVLNMLNSTSLVLKLGNRNDPEIASQVSNYFSDDDYLRISPADNPMYGLTEAPPINFVAPTGGEFKVPNGATSSNREKILKQLFGKSMSRIWGAESQTYVESLMTYVNVRVRRSPGGEPKNYTLRLHKSVALNYVNAFEDLLNIPGFWADNSLYGYSWRKIAGTNKISNHGFGIAIDLNVKLNPYLKGQKAPQMGDCSNPRMYRSMNHPVVQALARHGIGWGGTFGDYMHFSIIYGW